MKKLIATIAALAMMALGLVAASGNVTATAGGCYPGTVNTTTKIKAPTKVKKGKKATVKVSVASASDAPMAGKVTVTFSGVAKSSKTVTYSGGSKSFTSPKLKKTGKLKVSAKFKPTGGCNVLKASSASKTIKVVK